MFSLTRRFTIVAAALIGLAAVLQVTTHMPAGGVLPAYAKTQGEQFEAISAAQLPQEARDTLAIIEKGPPFPFKRDATVFKNREKRLPVQAHPEYYREYTVKTPGVQGSGARRIVKGKNGELYYTQDHYQTFRLIKQEGQPPTAQVPELGTIALADLPPEARDTLAHIELGGPFPFHGDRSVFRNRERLLPQRTDPEYYRAYKVETPGDATSGGRRIVAGKGGERYYTEDRFKTLKLIKE